MNTSSAQMTGPVLALEMTAGPDKNYFHVLTDSVVDFNRDLLRLLFSIANAQRRVVFGTENSRIVFSAVGAKSAIRTMLSQCGRVADSQRLHDISPVSPKPPDGTISRLETGFSHGVRRRSQGQPIAPFKITTSAGGNYFIKLVDMSTNSEALVGFISGGTAFVTKMPAGRYELRYAFGFAWINEIDFFGPETIFSKAATPLNFTSDGHMVRGLEVELIRQKGGNLRTTTMRKQDF